MQEILYCFLIQRWLGRHPFNALENDTLCLQSTATDAIHRREILKVFLHEDYGAQIQDILVAFQTIVLLIGDESEGIADYLVSILE